jgi:hypothetical protein
MIIGLGLLKFLSCYMHIVFIGNLFILSQFLIIFFNTDLHPIPQICNMCVVQLEAAYDFINLCKATLRNKPFRVDDVITPVTLKKLQQIDEPMEQQTRFDTLFIASDYPVDVKLEPIDSKYEEDFLTKSKATRDPDPDCK